MSFDLYFLTDASAQGWEAAMEELELRAEEETDLTPAEIASWDRLRGPVQELLPGSTEFVSETGRQLSHDATGIQVSMSAGEFSLTVPYWTEGAQAEQTVARLKAVAAAVQDATGLTAFDPQSELPFLAGGDSAAPSMFDRARSALRSHLQ